MLFTRGLDIIFLNLKLGNELLNGDLDIKPFGEASSRMLSILSELVDKELVSTIVWAKVSNLKVISNRMLIYLLFFHFKANTWFHGSRIK